MARLARVVVPGYPHHITQRGNRRQKVFFRESDYSCYLYLLREWCGHEDIEIWAYCLMTNHVHLVVTPNKYSNLGRAIGETHRRYTRMINFREGWKGYLWQGRFWFQAIYVHGRISASEWIMKKSLQFCIQVICRGCAGLA